MASERIKLFEADIDTDGIIKKSVELREQMVDLRQNQKFLKMTVGETNEEFIKNEARLKAVSKEYRLNQQQVSNLASSSNEFFGITEKLVGALDKEVLSISNAKDNNKELRVVRDQLNAKTVEGAAAIEEINKKIDDNTAFIKSNVSELEVQKINIGDYKNQIVEAYNELDIFNGGILGFIGRAQQAGGVTNLLTNSTKGLVNGIWGMTKASLAFIATPIGVVLAAIGIVMGALIGYINGTQEGLDKLTAITRPLSAIFQTLIGVLQDVGKYLFDAFNNPKKTITEVYEFVKDKVIRVFEAYMKILVGVATLDFTKAKEGLSDINDIAVEGIDAIKKAAGGIANTFEEAYKKGQRIDELQKQLERREINIIAWRAEAEKQLKDQEVISKNLLLSADERIKAENEKVRIAKEIVKRENEILDIQIEQLKIKQSLNDTSRDDEKELQELIAQKIKNSEKETEIEKQGLSTRTAIAKEEASANKKAQDERDALAKKAIDDAISRQEQSLSLLREQRKFDEDNLDKIKFFAVEELKILDQKLKDKLVSDLEYNIEKQKIANTIREAEIEKENKEIERIKEFNQRKTDLENEIELKKIEDKTERELAKADLDFEKHLAELETLQLNEQEKTELLALLETERQQIIDEITKAGLDKRLEDFKNYSKAELQARQQNAQEAAGIAQQLTGILSSILGDSLAAKLASLAVDAAIQAGLVAITSTAAQATNLAQATAVAPPPLNAAFIAAALAQNATIKANSTKAITKIIGSAALKGIGVAAGSMRKGERGLSIDIGGKRHSSGGTKFYGEDGTAFEAEKGEKMFILNRQASAALAPLLSDINQQYGGISLSRPASYLAAGGQILRNPKTYGGIDFTKMQEAISESVREGAAAGTRVGAREGSASGTHSGIVDREDNIAIAAGANF